MAINSNEPTYIEDFRNTQADWANGNNARGDPDPNVDWLPAFKRAAFNHLVTDGGDPLRFQHTYQRLVFVGRTRGVYTLSGTLDLFGLRLEGLYPGVRLNFDQGTDGIHIHYPTTAPGPGTSFNLPAPVMNYGGECTLRNLDLSGTGAVGTRGVIIQDGSLLEAVAVRNFGWHGFHVTADTTRGVSSVDGAISNANGTTLLNCKAIDCGQDPGTDARTITAANPNGNRIFGSGLRLEGGDSNQCYSRSFYAFDCGGWAIDDVSFLGNQHDLPQAVNCHHVVTDWELAIGSHPGAIASEKRDFASYGVSVGQKINLAFRMANVTARGIMMSPYVEDVNREESQAIVDVLPNSFVVGGRGGRDSSGTTRIARGELTNSWGSVGKGTATSDETVLAEGDGVFLSFVSKADSGGVLPYRLKYAHFPGDDHTHSADSDILAGFYRLDRGNRDAEIALAFTGEQSYEKTGSHVTTRQLDAGRLVLFSHYRAINYTRYRRVEYGSSNDLGSLEAALPAADRQIGDAFVNLIPSQGSIYEAVVVNDQNLGRNVWAAVSNVPR